MYWNLLINPHSPSIVYVCFMKHTHVIMNFVLCNHTGSIFSDVIKIHLPRGENSWFCLNSFSVQFSNGILGLNPESEVEL